MRIRSAPVQARATTRLPCCPGERQRVLDSSPRHVIQLRYTAVMGTVWLLPAMQRAARMLRAPTRTSPTDLPEPPGEPAPILCRSCALSSRSRDAPVSARMVSVSWLAREAPLRMVRIAVHRSEWWWHHEPARRPSSSRIGRMRAFCMRIDCMRIDCTRAISSQPVVFPLSVSGRGQFQGETCDG